MSYSSDEMKRYNNLVSEIDSAYHAFSLKFGISDSVSYILYTICSVGESCLLSDICKKTGLSKQTVNSAIRGLEREDIIYLAAVDGKAKKVCLTEKGKVFVKNTVERIIETENDIFSAWESSDVEKYLELTERFLAALRDKINTL